MLLPACNGSKTGAAGSGGASAGGGGGGVDGSIGVDGGGAPAAVGAGPGGPSAGGGGGGVLGSICCALSGLPPVSNSKATVMCIRNLMFCVYRFSLLSLMLP